MNRNYVFIGIASFWLIVIAVFAQYSPPPTPSGSLTGTPQNHFVAIGGTGTNVNFVTPGTGAGDVFTSNGLFVNPSFQPLGAHLVSFALNCVVSSGSTTAYSCQSETLFTISQGDIVMALFDQTNIGSATFTPNPAFINPALIKKKQGTVNLSAGDIQQNGYGMLVYDGTNWQLVSQPGQ